ncbi:MAG: D-sedoheptulose 7-phosphate isomerase [Deltaproteobacteria bacterium]|jgi:D-sedoheptulose 7-phosphate isomerase|nr:D-sedoheptulose 7-phosphate isomerase [Deltaproteobacteria bacterium]
MKDVILSILEAAVTAKRNCVESNVDNLIKGTDLLTACLRAGGKVLIFGNGGSAADAQHLAAELVNRFQIERPPLAAIALTTDSSVLTSIGNDYHFDEIFSKQISALGKKGDIAWGLSTSGNSPNVIKAFGTAQKLGMATIGMTGRGGKIARCADLVFAVASDTTARIQEIHIMLGHILCELLERALYPEEFLPKT